MDLSTPELLTFWVAMTPSHRENGCVRVLPGTHKAGKLPHGATSVSNRNLLGSGLEVVTDYDQKTAVDLVLKPGELSLHHVFVVHGSEPNHSQEDRLGYVVKIIPTRVSQAFPHFPVVLARGEDEFGHWNVLESPPEGDFDSCLKRHIAFSEALQAKRRALGRKTG